MSTGAGPPAAALGWAQVAAHRLRRNLLAGRGAAAPATVAAQLCGLHAQLLSSAQLSLWARIGGLTADGFADALWRERSLVKLWAMRGTLHLLPATEYPAWRSALATYRHFLRPSWSKAFGVTPAQLDELIAAVHTALDGPPLTRAELADAVAARTGSADLGERLRESWGALLKPASFRGALCFADGEGARVRFTRPDRWLGIDPDAPEPPDGDQAVTDIVRRYLDTHGPADADEIARWWAMSPAAARKVLRRLGDEVTEIAIDGRRRWALARSVEAMTDASVSRTVNLLPAFDPWIIAATRQPGLLTGGEAVRPLVYRNQGWISPVVLVNGMAAGTWRHERTSGRTPAVKVTVEPFDRFAPWARTAVTAEAEALAAHLGGDLRLTWS